MTNEKNFADELIEEIEHDKTLTDDAKRAAIQAVHKTQQIKVNMLITGATGCGKSSTINALFGSEKAKVGQGVNPETMDIQKFEYNNIILWDFPGLGDSNEADIRHSKNIINKLYEKDSNGALLIDLVLVILDGGSRDLGTSFELITKVIIPNLGGDNKRLLIAINQADMAMKGRNWNQEKNQPEADLIKFLDEKVASTRRRIKEATGVGVEPIYYSAGYKDGDQNQKSYNLSKLSSLISQHTKIKKRSIVVKTKSELESARNNEYEEIVVTGKLANDLKKSKSIAYAGVGIIGMLTVALAATPFTGGLSAFAAVPIAALTGLEISAIIIAAALGIALIIAVFKDYEEISYSDGTLVLRKKQKDDE